MPKNWKYIKKLLEKEFLCEKLKGQITYDLTQYSPALWYQKHFIMKYNGRILFEATQSECFFDKSFKYGNKYYLSNRIYEKYNKKHNENDKKISASVFQFATDEILKYYSHKDGQYGVDEIIEAIGEYLHSDIKTNLKSDNPFIVALAVLDRRCGKRTFENKKWIYKNAPHWLKKIIKIRFEAEDIRYIQ